MRLAGDAYGKPEPAPASDDDPVTSPEIHDVAGRIFAECADYCAQTDGSGLCTPCVKVDVDNDGLAGPVAATLEVDPPIELDATLREACLVVGIVHGEWVRDVEVTPLDSESAERREPLDNIVASLHVYARGLGVLPPNMVQ